MRMNVRWVAAASAAAGFLIAVGCFGLQHALAAGTGSGTAGSPTVEITTDGSQTEAALPVRQLLAKSVDELAGDLHLTVQQLRADLAAGQSLADIAAAQHVSQTGLENDLKSLVHNDLQQLVSQGKITPAKAAAAEQRIDERLPDLMKDKHLLQHLRHVSLRGQLLQQAAKDLKMSEQDLLAQLRQGKSLAQVAQDHGVSPDTLKSELETYMDQRVATFLNHFMNRTHWGSASSTQ